ncbi:MAG: Xaa-Pro peptidase family protein [Alphaproteobacteria bacterium]|jgi:Xaa-Pro dipeptidase|nr:Xaa-Pro peptidase family protein [Alphaproteobacteria bacterium]MDP6813966.1 Xaa-Pro peptidase family protein [Alphaproteobacteria bacterium]
MVVTASFGQAEFAARLAATQAAMAAQDLDLLIADRAEDITYLSGFAMSETRYRCCLVPSVGEPALLARQIDRPAAVRSAWFDDVHGYADWVSPGRAIAGIAAARGWAPRRIGADFTSYGFTGQILGEVRAAFPAAEVTDCGPLVSRLRAVKSPAEVALLRRAATIADATMAHLAGEARPGRSAREVHFLAAAHFAERGADPGQVGPIVKCGDSLSLHPTLEDDALADGDVLHVELLPKVAGYSARLMRPIAVGRAGAGEREHAEALVAAQDRQLAALAPGRPAAAVDGLLREALSEAGLRDGFSHITGYVLGDYYDWTPRGSDLTYAFHPEADWHLAAGMTFHMYAASERMSVSETVLITDDGHERLTRTPRVLLTNT